MRVVAVVVRLCGRKETKAAGFKFLPEDGRSVLAWRSADAAFLDVAQGICKLVKTLRAEMAAGPAKPVRVIPNAKVAAKTNHSPAAVKAKPPAKAKTTPAKPKAGQPKVASKKAMTPTKTIPRKRPASKTR